MTKKLLVVTSSVRNTRAADNIESIVNEELKKFNLDVSRADFKEMPLPFFDSPAIPSSEEFSPNDENVKKWTKMVAEADSVVMLVAEYNHSYTAVIKNAIDWVYKEWQDKPVAMIGYGWAGGSRATRHLRDILNGNINTKALEKEANLHFTKEIDLDGSPIGNEASKQVEEVLKQL